MHSKIIKSKNVSLNLFSDFRKALSFAHFMRELKSFPEPLERRFKGEKTGTPPPQDPVERSFSGVADKAGHSPLQHRPVCSPTSCCCFWTHPHARHTRASQHHPR